MDRIREEHALEGVRHDYVHSLYNIEHIAHAHDQNRQ